MSDSRERDYLRDRVEQYRGWYDARARFCKKWHLRLRVVALALATCVPALIAWRSSWATVSATVAAVGVLLCIALEGVLRLREQWGNYRYTEQYLDRERYLYTTSSGMYRGLAPGDAFACFVERVEWAIAAENSATLTTLALAPDIRSARRADVPDWRSSPEDGAPNVRQ